MGILKLSRNAKCFCGSGKKFKKCHGKKEGAKNMDEIPKLKNEFRKEAADPYAGITREELTLRDQEVLRQEIRFYIDMKEENKKHIQLSIGKSKIFKSFLLSMPKSPYKENSLNDVEALIKKLEIDLSSACVPISWGSILSALDELANLRDESKPDLSFPKNGKAQEDEEDFEGIDDEDDDNESLEISDQ